MKDVVIAQISDSHLYADPQANHYGHVVADNLRRILGELKNIPTLNAVVFTGDLTQDHSTQAYLNFANAIKESELPCPVYWVAGNHDEPQLLQAHLSGGVFREQKTVALGLWQLLLIDSKTETPAGLVRETELLRLSQQSDGTEFTLVFLHHHPLDMGYFIDRHGLQNQAEFWHEIRNNSHIRAVACGHVHRGETLLPAKFDCNIPLYTCPATSIQFDPTAPSVSALPMGPGFQLFHLTSEGTVLSELKYLDVQ